MPRPLPKGVQFYMEFKCAESHYEMPTYEVCSEYYELGYMTSGDRLTLTPTYQYITHSCGGLGTLSPYVYHRTIPASEAPYEGYLIKYTPEFVRPLTDTFGMGLLDDIYAQPYCLFSPRIQDRVYELLETMYELYRSDSPYAQYRLRGMLCELLLLIKEERLPFDETQSVTHAPLSPAIINAILYLEEHYRESPSLEGTASLHGYSPSHFSRLFYAQTGKSYSEYLIAIRLRHAASLLLGSRLSITQIAHETGYAHSSHLSSQFKAHMGMSPNEYRKSNNFAPDGCKIINGFSFRCPQS